MLWSPVGAASLLPHTETGNLVLDDATASPWSRALISRSDSDLIGAVSATPLAGGGFLQRVRGSHRRSRARDEHIHTASYQYIPALVLPKKQQMNLRRTIRRPSQAQVGHRCRAPAVEAPQLPPLRSVRIPSKYFASTIAIGVARRGRATGLFSGHAHDLYFTCKAKAERGRSSARADAASGGFVVDTHAVEAATARSRTHRHTAWFLGLRAI